MKFLNKPFPAVDPDKYRKITDFAQTAIIFLLLLLFFTFIRPAAVPSLSMYPTMDINELSVCLTTSHFDYGDIVLFHPPMDPSITYVKRVVGKGGDTIAVHDGYVWRNGEKLIEPYVEEPIEYEMDEIVVPEGEFFLMGDNRNNSQDSHVIGPIEQDAIYAKVLFHFNPAKALNLN